MILDKKIVTVTPAGRKVSMEILKKYIDKLFEMNLIDEHHWWVNTDVKEDIKFMENTVKENPDLYKMIIQKTPIPEPKGFRIGSFFKIDSTEKDTVYVRFDDDIVYINVNKFEEFVKFRIKNPQYFLVYANILNNAILTHIYQRNEILNLDVGIADYGCTGVAWSDWRYAEALHNEFLKDCDPDKFTIDNWLLYYYERVSINCISWLGEEFAKFKGVIDADEEPYISTHLPFKNKKMNIIYGDFLVSHFAFFTQRDKLMEKDIMGKYKKLSEDI